LSVSRLHNLRPKRCKNCKCAFKPNTPLQYLCSPGCQKEYERKKSAGKEKKVRMPAVKLPSLGELKGLARSTFQRWVRLRDKGKPCISCGSTDTLVDGGHYLKAELFSGLIFHEMNCNGQCQDCNRGKDGNTDEYRVGMVNKYGETAVLLLEASAPRNRQYGYRRDELNEIIDRYNIKIKDLENGSNTKK
jgi:hypothetical protein